MAVLRIEGGELALHLSAAEKIGAVHGDLRVRLAAVSRVEVLEDAHEPADHGIKLGSTGRIVLSRMDRRLRRSRVGGPADHGRPDAPGLASLALRATPSTRRSRVLTSSGGPTPATIRAASLSLRCCRVHG